MEYAAFYPHQWKPGTELLYDNVEWVPLNEIIKDYQLPYATMIEH